MAITISLWSNKHMEIKRFLDSYYQDNVQSDESAQRWMGEFYNPLESIDMISALMDNSDNYEVIMYIHMDNGYLYKITKHNYNDVIRGLLSIFYMPC